MNVRFISKPPAWPALLALVLVPLGSSLAQAQTPAPPAAPATYRSALEGYQSYTDEKTLAWKEANDKVGRIGGWREYAKQAQQPQVPDAPAKLDPRAVQAKP